MRIIILVISFLLAAPIITVFAYTHVTTLKQASGVYNVASYPGDYYAWGNCTWWSAMRRSQIGEPIPNNWGNAATWASRAALAGYIVDHIPSYGAIMQISNVDHGLGHVAFVESVDPDGTWHISEMNVLGLDVVDYKTMPATAATDYNFIHSPM
jgi:surface antigen